MEGVKQLFIGAKSRADVYYAILALQRSFHDGHSQLRADDLVPQKPSVRLPLKFVPRFDGKNWIYKVEQSLTPEIPVNSILISVDDQDSSTLEKNFVRWNRNSSLESLRISLANWLSSRNPVNYPSPDVGDVIKLRIKIPGKDGIQETKLIWKERESVIWTKEKATKCGEPLPNDSDYTEFKIEFVGLKYCVYSSKRSDTKIIRYFSFDYFFENSAELWNRIALISYKPSLLTDNNPDEYSLARLDQKKLIDWLKNKKLKKVFLDLRENGGGGLFFNLPAAFASKPFKSTYLKLWLGPALRTHPELLLNMMTPSQEQIEIYKKALISKTPSEFSPVLPFFCTSNECDFNEATISATGELKHIELIVISGPECYSSCDQNVAIFKTNGIAKLAGMPTAAGSSPSRIDSKFKLNNGSFFTMSLTTVVTLLPNGEVLEGNPVPLDILLYPSTKNKFNYLKSVMAINGN